jgi:predicted transglutaminase-like cysteine proteinase
MNEMKEDSNFDLKDFNKHFTYVSDGRRRDRWHIMKRKPYRGDCEDYALTVLYNLKGRSLLRMFLSLIKRQSRIRHCKVNGNGHATLKYKGKYIDNGYKRWVKKDTMKKNGYKFHKIHYLPYVVLLKLLKGFILK